MDSAIASISGCISLTEPSIHREIHTFTYSLYPHTGNWKTAGTVQMAYALNCPMYTKFEPAHEGLTGTELSMATVNCENVIIDTIKWPRMAMVR